MICCCTIKGDIVRFLYKAMCFLSQRGIFPVVSMEWCSCAVVLKTGQCLNSTDKCHNEVSSAKTKQNKRPYHIFLFSFIQCQRTRPRKRINPLRSVEKQSTRIKHSQDNCFPVDFSSNRSAIPHQSILSILREMVILKEDHPYIR